MTCEQNLSNFMGILRVFGLILISQDLKKDGSAFTFIVEREFDLDFYFRVYFSYMKDFNAIVAFPHLEENGQVLFF